jgi:hypothetical protein
MQWPGPEHCMLNEHCSFPAMDSQGLTIYCTALHCTALHCTALHNPPVCTIPPEPPVSRLTAEGSRGCLLAGHCTVLHCTVLHCTVLHCTALHCTALHCTALCCTVLHYTVLHCTVLYCTVLYCTALHCTELHYARNCTALHISPSGQGKHKGRVA